MKDIINFKNSVYDTVCQCPDQCIGLNREDFKKSPQPICSEIIRDKDNNMNYEELILESLNLFIENELLKKSGTKYYIINPNGSTVKLTWENIKEIKDNNTKELFWLLRKLVVDGILKMILKGENSNLNIILEDIKIYSVGSTSITSDYDITLYGNTKNKIYIMKNFQELFIKYFGEDSSIVFDTNIYGKAYITFENIECKEYLTLKKGCGQKFYYINENPSQDSQIMWGLIKYMRDLREAFGELIYNNIYRFMSDKLKDFEILNMANTTLIHLKNKDEKKVNYRSLIERESDFLRAYDKKDKLIGIHDHISVVNFYGTETYYTRGAFLDTVINTQTCKEKDIIKLEAADYIASILENSGFYFIHGNKTKYIRRVYKTTQKLIQFEEYIKIGETNAYKELDKILINLGKDDEQYCNNLDINGEIDLLSCQKYKLFNITMNLVYKILEKYNENGGGKSQILFYDIYILKRSEIMGSPIYQMASLQELAEE